MKKANIDLKHSLSSVVIRTALKVKSEARRFLREEGYDTTPEQWVILRILLETAGQSQRELAERTFKDTPNITRILDILEKKGLVVRKRHETDRRSFKIFLTGKGKRLEKELSATLMKIEEKVKQNLRKSEIACIKKAMRTIGRSLG